MNEFFATIYEAGTVFYFNDFSDQLYQHEVYAPIGWFLLISSPLWMTIYYRLIDHVNFSRWFHWLLWLVILCIFNFCFAYFWSSTELTDKYQIAGREVPFSGEFVNFSLVNVLYSIVLALVFSLVLKKFAVNTKRTPF